MIRAVVSGSTKKTEAFLKKMASQSYFSGLEAIAREGVTALANATPTDSGLASSSWGFEIQRSRSSLFIRWTNTDVETGFPVSIMLQFGYATGTGGYVQGRDYINPAIKPVFDRLVEKVWKVVTSA
jgi:hypothetical protein